MVGRVGGARGVVPITLRRASFAFSGILWKRSTCRVSITEGLWLSPLPPPVPSGPPVAPLSLPLTPYESRTRACMKHCAQPSSYCCCVITVFLACFLALTRSPPYFQVRAQHNHSDCGLYMLKYIELLSEHRTPSSARWKAAPTKRQKEYNELKFSDVSIDEKRREMSIEIRRLGREQEEERQLQQAIRASREQHAASGPS